MHYSRIDLVVGTRPEAIKLAPVALALAARGLAVRLLLTCQHALDMAEHGLGQFAAIELGCPGQRDPMAHAAAVEQRVRAAMADPPALLVIQGDTSSALGGARAGVSAGVPVAHVEAGLRSFDPAMPWPEELNRMAIDGLSTLLFAPTHTSADNLRDDKATGAVIITGNTGIDALFAVLGRLGPAANRPDDGVMRLLVTCHRRENWGSPMRAVAAAINHLAVHEAVHIHVVLHINPAVAAAMSRAIKAHPAVELLPPLGHAEMIGAMRGCDVLLSDSGGVQEEAPALGLPLLVLRDKTERPEGIASGNMLLAGTDRDRIIALVMRLMDPAVRAGMSRPSLPFSDGQAGPRIADAIVQWLDAQRGGLRAAG